MFRDIGRTGGFGGVGGGSAARWRFQRRWRQFWRRRRVRPLVVSTCRSARTLRHLCATRAGTRRRFTDAVDASIESAIRAAETRSSGEIRFVIETALDIPELWAGVTPRERALQVFSRAARLGHRTSQRRTHLCIGGRSGRRDRGRPRCGQPGFPLSSGNPRAGSSKITSGPAVSRKARWPVSTRWVDC